MASGTQPRWRTPCIVRLAISAANSSSVRYSGLNGSAPKLGPDGAARRSAGSRSRSDVTRPAPSAGSSQPRSAPRRHRMAKRARTAGDEPEDGSPDVNARTSRGKSSRSPGVGSSHTSSSRKSDVSSWIRHGCAVWAVAGSLMIGPRSSIR